MHVHHTCTTAGELTIQNHALKIMVSKLFPLHSTQSVQNIGVTICSPNIHLDHIWPYMPQSMKAYWLNQWIVAETHGSFIGLQRAAKNCRLFSWLWVYNTYNFIHTIYYIHSQDLRSGSTMGASQVITLFVIPFISASHPRLAIPSADPWDC